MASSTAAAPLTCLHPAAQASRLPPAATAFARLPAAHSGAWGRAAVSVAAPRRRRRAPGVVYAAATTEKSIYDFTVKVGGQLSRSRLVIFAIIVNGLRFFGGIVLGLRVRRDRAPWVKLYVRVR